MQCPTLNKDVFKFPSKPILRKYLKNYITQYELSSKGITTLSGDGNKDDTAFLLKIIWGVAQVLGD